jgi:hypothetical protein
MTEALNFPARVDQPIGDEMLRSLARLPNAKVTISLVLMVPGGIVTGTLISRDQWLEEWLNEIEAAEGIGGQIVANALRGLINNQGVYVIDDELAGKDRPARLHLKNCYINSGGEKEGPLLLRVRVESVSAWSLGTPKPKGV